MTDMVFIKLKGFVYIVNMPRRGMSENEMHSYARSKIGAKDEDITLWGQAEFEDGMAMFVYDFEEEEKT